MQTIGELLTTTEVLSLDRKDNVLAACKAMEARGVGAVLVRGAESECEGIFTERDLMVRVVVEGRDPSTTLLGDVCSLRLYTAAPSDLAEEVRREMRHRHIRHVPVVEDGKVHGVISLRDLLRATLKEKTQEVEAITSYIQGFLPPDEG